MSRLSHHTLIDRFHLHNHHLFKFMETRICLEHQHGRDRFIPFRWNVMRKGNVGAARKVFPDSFFLNNGNETLCITRRSRYVNLPW